MPTTFTSKFSLIQQVPIPNLRDDVPTFMGMPHARTAADLKGADVAIIGVPYDRTATAGRPADQWAGYREAPAHVRRASLRFAGYVPELDLDVFEHLSLVDYGDAEIVPDLDRSIDNVARKVQEALAGGCLPVTIGGFSPCASYAVIQGVAAATPGTIGVISLDAHCDNQDTEYGPQGSRAPGSATWERRMWDDFKNVDPTRHVEIGIRGPRNTRAQLQTYRDLGAACYTAPKAREMGIEAVCREAVPKAFAGTARTWLHLDMDVLDIGAIPNWGDEPLGLSTWEVIKIVHEAGKAGLDGLSFVYVAPNSAGAAAVVCYTIVYFLAGRVLGKK
jgi:agmatinase